MTLHKDYTLQWRAGFEDAKRGQEYNWLYPMCGMYHQGFIDGTKDLYTLKGATQWKH